MIIKQPVRKTIDLEEYGEERCTREEIAFLGSRSFDLLEEVFKPIVRISSDPTGQFLSFMADSNVGALEYQGLRVQVRPRLSANEFSTLIWYVLRGSIPPSHFRLHTELSWRQGFADVLCTILCDEAWEISRKGISRKYMESQEYLQVLRGRILWEKNFPWIGNKATRINCRHYRLTYDNLDNRLLLSGLRKGANLSESGDVKRKTIQHLREFSELASEIVPDQGAFAKVNEGYSRLNEHYRVAHGLSRMLLFDLRPKTFFEEGKHATFGVVLDMAALFEDFVEKCLGDLLEREGFRLVLQKRDPGALLDGNNDSYASVRPDIQIWKGENIWGVLDAKYKWYWMADKKTLHPIRKISNEDLYQMFFYQQRLRTKYNLSSPPNAFIAAPLPEADETGYALPVSERYKRVTWQADMEKFGDVRLILIPMTKFLRLIGKGMGATEALGNLEMRNELLGEG